MDGPEQRCQPAAPKEIISPLNNCFLLHSQQEQISQQEKNEHRIGAVEHEVAQVEAERIQAKQFVSRGPAQPGQGHVVARVEGGEHPAELIPAETAVIRIVEEVQGIVPGGEAVAQCRQEGGERDAFGQ